MKWAVHWLLVATLPMFLEALPSLPSNQLLTDGSRYFSYYYQPPLSNYYHTVHESVLNNIDPYTYTDDSGLSHYTEAPSYIEAQTYSYGQGFPNDASDDANDATSAYYAAAMFPHYSQPPAQIDESDEPPSYHNKLPVSNSKLPSTHFESDPEPPPSYYNRLPASDSKLPSTHFTTDPDSSGDPEPPPSSSLIPSPSELEDETDSASSLQQYSEDIIAYANQIFSFNPQFHQPAV